MKPLLQKIPLRIPRVGMAYNFSCNRLISCGRICPGWYLNRTIPLDIENTSRPWYVLLGFFIF
jgi:hypothetical protein